jgi:hypothetical protein
MSSDQRFKSPVLYAADESAAIEALHEARRTDGLPVVAPTPQRVEQMLLHAQGLEPDWVLGQVAPMGGELTVEAAAINAVMAGCKPEIFPLVIAACEAIVDPLFDVGPLQNTTHCITPLIIVNGPARMEYGVAWGVGAMGPGHRANVTLGRAIRLVMINVGGGIVGVGDMATIGSPAKIACCIAEDEDESPFADTLHVSRGFAPEDSTVTVLGVEGPHSLIYNFGGDEGPEGFLRLLAAGFSSPTSNNIYLGKGTVAAALNPVHARLLRAAGLSRREAQQKIFDYSRTTWGEVRKLCRANVAANVPDDGITHAVAKPEDILLFSSGEEGAIYSAFFPSWGAGKFDNQPVTKKVRTPDFCEVAPSLR